jgi:hypothetical protein
LDGFLKHGLLHWIWLNYLAMDIEDEDEDDDEDEMKERNT